MLRIFFQLKCTRVLLLLICFGLVGGCNSLDRKYPESSMLVVQMDVEDPLETAANLVPLSFDFGGEQSSGGLTEFFVSYCLWSSGLMPAPVPVLYIRRFPEDGSTPVSSSEYHEGTFIFPDVTAGRYRIFELWLPVNGGDFVDDEFDRLRRINTVVVSWDADNAKLSETNALPHTVNFMGEYEVELRARNDWTIVGDTSAEKEERALSQVRDEWSGDWPEQADLQLRGAY